jgi:glycosyltransferase involved in cell wall biosynthesis
MAEATDATIVVTDYLKSLYAPVLQARIHVVHDGIEHPEYQCTPAFAARRGRLTATLVTSHSQYHLPVIGGVPPGWAIDIVGAFPPASQLVGRLRALRWAMHREQISAVRWQILWAALDPRIRHIRWCANSVYAKLCASDIAIIPIDKRRGDPLNTPSWKVKSENRLTLKMSIGLPVIATPIPAYEDIIQHGVNGFFARSANDWKHCFQRLRDPQLRAEMGRKARASVLLRFSKERQAECFAQVLRTLGPASVDRSDPS